MPDIYIYLWHHVFVRSAALVMSSLIENGVNVTGWGEGRG
jgi:hypothetical protein